MFQVNKDLKNRYLLLACILSLLLIHVYPSPCFVYLSIRFLSISSPRLTHLFFTWTTVGEVSGGRNPNLSLLLSSLIVELRQFTVVRVVREWVRASWRCSADWLPTYLPAYVSMIFHFLASEITLLIPSLASDIGCAQLHGVNGALCGFCVKMFRGNRIL